MKRLLGIVIVIAVIITGVWLLTKNSSSGGVKQANAPAWAVDVADFQDQEENLSAYLGQPIVLNLWASWCPFCVQELPDFVALQQQYPGVTVIAVNRRESADVAQEFLNQEGLAPDGLVWRLDRRDDLYQNIGGFAMPETLFIDAKGNVITHKRGFMTLEEMMLFTEQLLDSEQA